jgi:hypothetical protein
MPASGDLSRFSISRNNYPMHMDVPMDFVVLLFEKMAGSSMSAKDLRELKEKSKKFSYLATWAFVGSFGGGGEVQMKDREVKFKLPDLPIYYDGFIVLPYLIKRRADESIIAIYDATKVSPLRYAVQGDLSKTNTIPKFPVKEEPKEKKEVVATINGVLNVSSFEPRELTMGQTNKLDVEISFQNLKPNSQIYVILNTMAGDQLVSMADGYVAKRSFTSVKFTMCNKSIEAKSSTLKIDPVNRPIYATAPFLGDMEAAYVGETLKGGNGKINATVTFEPPVFSTYYNTIRITPIALEWDDDGNLCALFDSDKMKFSTVRIAGK